jgi:expansin (peptidoglycan-binding protein)
MIAAMNHVDYAASAICGAYVEISGPKGLVTVRIVDQCPECPAGNIDLSPQAFARIADLVAGRVPISWRIVSPDISGPIRYHFKEGSSQWWTAVQIRNHRNPIAKFEYRAPSGQFKTVPRVDYNFFVDTSGMGVGPYTFRVTDSAGNVLTDSTIPLTVGGDVAGSGQFPQVRNGGIEN